MGEFDDFKSVADESELVRRTEFLTNTMALYEVLRRKGTLTVEDCDLFVELRNEYTDKIVDQLKRVKKILFKGLYGGADTEEMFEENEKLNAVFKQLPFPIRSLDEAIESLSEARRLLDEQKEGANNE